MWGGGAGLGPFVVVLDGVGIGVRARFGPFIVVLDSVCAGTGVHVPVGAVLVLGCSSFDLLFALARSLF